MTTFLTNLRTGERLPTSLSENTTYADLAEEVVDHHNLRDVSLVVFFDDAGNIIPKDTKVSEILETDDVQYSFPTPPEWVPWVRGADPPRDAVEVTPGQYVARGVYQNGQHPGYATAEGVFISWGGKTRDVSAERFRPMILCIPPSEVEWRSFREYNSRDAVPTGSESNSRTPLHSLRCTFPDGATFSGKFGVCGVNVPYQGGESRKQYGREEILCFVQSSVMVQDIVAELKNERIV